MEGSGQWNEKWVDTGLGSAQTARPWSQGPVPSQQHTPPVLSRPLGLSTTYKDDPNPLVPLVNLSEMHTVPPPQALSQHTQAPLVCTPGFSSSSSAPHNADERDQDPTISICSKREDPTTHNISLS